MAENFITADHHYVVTLGKFHLAFDDTDAALKFYALLDAAHPVDIVSHDEQSNCPARLRNVRYVSAANDVDCDFKRIDADNFALDMTREEYDAMLKKTEVEIATDKKPEIPTQSENTAVMTDVDQWFRGMR